MSNDWLAILYAFFLRTCKAHGMTTDEVCDLFTKKKVQAGYEILEGKA